MSTLHIMVLMSNKLLSLDDKKNDNNSMIHRENLYKYIELAIYTKSLKGSHSSQ